ncbi:SusC/RagA family TonB-linked outer membrane protein [Pedobacter heparinus]|uniref:TonB-dependent receptor plug n=1 Tax=Pedobacter heparinus (strain ATCC 13125 / DSM 2366 / CIP 104194 / JCM 7457 / NBRC 12017 / NCIMB 9290 / NRRL B-14731 / HIM 762-3) TaxID=485917 RepID=C6XUM1_PEDHD|nr:SusC/RagA family TonB-linked outer membrane protein [Pedobacter heparinus]ACU03871.1 TonB-dependent receptor plug [Pedobacter heparinus DSM 2366]
MYKNYIIKPDIPKRYVYKILLVMRLTTVILIASMLQVSASSLAQKFSYVKKDVPLLQVFKELKKQTGYNILWNEKEINVTTLIDANFKKSSIEEVMDACLGQLPFSYTINDKMVLIKQKELSFRDKITSFLAAIDVRGRVLDENDAPLVGAVVKVKGTKQATSTNNNGDFVMNGVDEKATLVVSFLGYEAKEIAASKNVGSIRLTLNTDRLEEVQINAGYYTVNDRERTGNISRVTAKEIEKQPVNNVVAALQNRVPGLQIVQQTGVPGGGFTVQIRGRSSINSFVGNLPLYIIDGVIYPSTTVSANSTIGIFGGKTGYGASPLSSLNPGDIESIEILKDADATAIYGSRGANGVILITTKKGISGLTKVRANVSQGYSEVGHRIDLLNTQEYLEMRREAFKNDGLSPSTTDYDINGTWDQNKYTDWQKTFIGNKAHNTNASLGVTGGNEKSNYLIAGSYSKEGTVFPGNFGIDKAGISSSINLGTPSERFNANFSASFNHIKQNLLNTDLTIYMFLTPNFPDLRDQYGQLNYSNNTISLNPLVFLSQPNNANMNTLIGNVSLSYKFLKNLVFKTALGYSSILRTEFVKFPLAAINPAQNPTSESRMSLFSDNHNDTFMLEPQIAYNGDFLGGKIEILGGMSLQKNDAQFRTIQASNYSSDEIMDNISGAALLTNLGATNSEYKYIAGFGRFNYKLLDKYFINLTARRDGSSRFGKDKQFANFGAVGAAWIISEENFLKKIPFITFAKLRASYGITGNDQIGNYGYLQLWTSTGTYQGKTTVTASGAAPNPDFSWETNKKAEAAIQLGFLEDMINLEISYYRNRSSSQLLSKTLPPSTGLTSLSGNLPGIVQNNGWEFNSTFKIINTSNWNWSLGFNLTIPKNKLVSYPGLGTSSDAINYQIGEPLNILKTSNVKVNSQTGLYEVEDKNGNGIVLDDTGDRYITKFLGQYSYGGLQNSIKYKQFNLDFLFAFSKQNGRNYRFTVPINAGRWLTGNQLTNQPSIVLNRWQNPNDEANVQRFGTTSVTNTANSASRDFGNTSVVDASFIKLRNISLSYSLPKNLLSKIKLNNVLLSLQGQNIFTITDYIGLDPETQAFTNLPPLRTLAMGISATF